MGKSNHKKHKHNHKQPLFFSEFAHKSTELLTKGYYRGQIFSFTTHKDLLDLTSTIASNGRHTTAGVVGAYPYKNATFRVGVDKDSKIAANFTVSEKFLSGTKTTASLSFPDYKSSKLKFQCLREYAALAMSVSLNQYPAIKFSAAVGSSSVALGMEAEFMTTSRCFSKCSAGINMKGLNCNASIILENKGDLLNASYVHYLDPEKRNAAVVQFTQELSTKRNTLTVGGSCAVDSHTAVKARLDDRGRLRTNLEYSFRPKSCLSISGEFNTQAVDRSPKIGVELAIDL
ncbi:mitochondrial outer membrane protein porin 2-like [Rosa rugosa]|uniref:mitochondrial outer membrane protein porin 2-like n=1 Tax=Rosa rugosa TaxID=74645 RepID=UPI002B40F7B9|nr:mitochondrial outer membrane protein porin 2-like [Rosa rugosa]